MHRLSLIISEVYNKYLPLAEKASVALNLDFSDTTKTVDNPDSIKADLEKHLSSALDRSPNGEISISVEKDAIIITDSGTILSKPVCALLSHGRVSVASRVGFGTTARISLLPPPKASTPTPQPTEPSQPVKVAPSKPTRKQRKLAAAAKRADRKIQKLVKSKQKSGAAKSKQKSGAAKSKPKSGAAKSKPKSVAAKPKPKCAHLKSTAKSSVKPKKTRKKVIELS